MKGLIILRSSSGLRILNFNSACILSLIQHGLTQVSKYVNFIFQVETMLSITKLQDQLVQ